VLGTGVCLKLSDKRGLCLFLAWGGPALWTAPKPTTRVGHIVVRPALVTAGLDDGVTYTLSCSILVFGLEGGVWYSRRFSELFKFCALLASVTLIQGSVPFPSSAIAKLGVNSEVHDMGTAGLTGIKSELTQPSPLPPGKTSLLCVSNALCVSNVLCVSNALCLSNAVSIVFIYDTHTHGLVAFGSLPTLSFKFLLPCPPPRIDILCVSNDKE
jgi:hypothetical protein